MFLLECNLLELRISQEFNEYFWFRVLKIAAVCKKGRPLQAVVPFHCMPKNEPPFPVPAGILLFYVGSNTKRLMSKVNANSI